MRLDQQLRAQLLLGTALTAFTSLGLPLLGSTSALAGSCMVSGAAVTCTGPASSSDTFQIFPSLPSGATVNFAAGAGIDTTGSSGTTYTPALSLQGSGALTVTVGAGNSLSGSNHGLFATSQGLLTINNDGKISSQNYAGIYAITKAGGTITNNGTISGASYGIRAFNDSASADLTIKTGNGSQTTAGPAASIYGLITDPFLEGPTSTPGAPYFEPVTVGIYAMSASGVTVETGDNSLVKGVNGIVAGAAGSGKATVKTGAGSQVLNEASTPQYEGNVAIQSLNGSATGTGVLVQTGDRSIVGGTSAQAANAPKFGIIAGTIGGSVDVITGSDSTVAARTFAITIQGGSMDTAGLNLTTGAGSTVDGGLAGIAAAAPAKMTTITTGENSLVKGGWAGILSNVVGDLTITTGTGSQVIATGGVPIADAVPGFPGFPATDPATGLAPDTIPTSGIQAWAVNGQQGDGNPGTYVYKSTNVQVATGDNSLVAGDGRYGDGIDAAAIATGKANIAIQTGAGSTVRGGDGFAMAGIGRGIGIQAMAQGLDGANINIATGADSLVEAGAVGINALVTSNFKANSIAIATGDRSTVRATGEPLAYDQDLNGQTITYTLPVTGINASAFGSVDTSIAVQTGKDSSVTGKGFGIAALSGVAATSIDIVTGENSRVEAVGPGPSVSGPAGIAELEMLQLYAAASGATSGTAGIYVGSTQFNELNQPAPNVDISTGEQFMDFQSRNETAGAINVTTGKNSSVTGKENGINISTMMMSQRLAAFAFDDQGKPVAITQFVVERDSNGHPTNLNQLGEADYQQIIVTRPGIAGTATVSVNGTVTGTEKYGVYNLNTGNALATTINVGGNGVVEGAKAGILVEANNEVAGFMQVSETNPGGIPILDINPDTGEFALATGFDQSAAAASINNSGQIRNLSAKSDALAIQTIRTAAAISNQGLVLGTVNLDADAGNHFINKAGGVWNTSGGTNEFGSNAAANYLETQSGSVIVAADSGAAAQTTTFNGLGEVRHGGILSLKDGATGDVALFTNPASASLSRMAAPTSTFISNGGELWLDTKLASDGAPSDLLVIEGDSKLGSGATSIVVSNAGGTGAKTVADGIKVVQVDGQSAADAFALKGNYVLQGQQAVVGGAYAYTLHHNGVTNTTDGDWYLRSEIKPSDPEPLYQAGAAVYENYPQLLLGLNSLPTLQQRVGNRFWNNNGNRVIAEGADAVTPIAPSEEAGSHIEGRGVWGRIEGAHTSMEPRFSTTNAEYDYNIFKMQAGLDGMLAETANGKLIGGITVHYAHGKADVSSASGDGNIASDGYGFGGTLTWYGDNGFYVDGQAQVTWYNSDLYSDTARKGLTDGNDGTGYALSLESGKRITINESWSVTPQAQLTYSSVDFDGFTDKFSARVGLDQADSLQGRLALSLEHQNSWQNAKGLIDRAAVYGIANLYHEFLDGTEVNLAGVSLASRNDRSWAGVGLGGSYNWDGDKYSIYGEGLVNTSLANFGDSYTVKGTIGFRTRW